MFFFFLFNVGLYFAHVSERTHAHNANSHQEKTTYNNLKNKNKKSKLTPQITNKKNNNFVFPLTLIYWPIFLFLSSNEEKTLQMFTHK